MSDTLVSTCVDIELGRVHVPRRLRFALTGAVRAVMHDRALLIHEIDTPGAAPASGQMEPILWHADIALIRVHVEVRVRSSEHVAISNKLNVAIGIGLVDIYVVMQRVALHDRHVAPQLRVSLERYVGVRRGRDRVGERRDCRPIFRAHGLLGQLRREPQSPWAIHRFRLCRGAAQLRVTGKRYVAGGEEHQGNERP